MNSTLGHARRLLAASLAPLLLSLPAWGQNYPAKPVTLVVPFPAGGTTDVLARALGQDLAQRLGQPIIVENKPGAGATLGADYVARAPADGYTLLMGAVHHTIATTAYSHLNYRFDRDLAPITTVALVPNVLTVNAKLPAQSVTDLIKLAQGKPGELTFGSNGVGTGQHLIGAQFESLASVKLLHVPYKGSGPLTTDLIGGQIDMSFDTITPVLPHIKSGKLRALAVTTAKRSQALPDTPTLDEAGLKGFDMGTWFGVLAPTGTPAPIIDTLNREMVAVIQSPDFQQRMAEIGAVPIGDSVQDMTTRVRDDTEKYGKLVKEAGIKLD